jgi:signal transduction histidine kinase
MSRTPESAGIPLRPFVPRRGLRLLALAGVYLSVWLVSALLAGGQTWLYGLYSGRPNAVRTAFTYPLTDAGLWAGLGIGVLWLARRFPFERGRIGIALAVHVPAAVACAIVESGLSLLVFERMGLFQGAPRTTAEMFRGLLIGKFHTNLLTYAFVVGVAHLIHFQRQVRDRELTASQLETRLAEARLEVLKMQLHPHFLFNTLHAVSTLMHRDVEAADRVLARLSDLLRLTLDSVDAHEVPLQREVEFIERYLEIQQTRFAGRLDVRLDIAPETRDALVPNLLLQPLVENAIRHGIAPRAAGGRVEIVASRAGTELRLEVRDDGPGVPDPARLEDGLGLANTRARLGHLYGAAHRFELHNRPEGGLSVTLVAPFRRATADPDAAPAVATGVRA